MMNRMLVRRVQLGGLAYGLLTTAMRESSGAMPAMLKCVFNPECIVKISREDVLRVADLAYLDLTEAELETYRAQIDEILEYIGKLNELDTANVEPMAQVLSHDQSANATLRDDVEVPCHIAAEVLKQAPDPDPPYFRVPKVIER